MRTGNDEQNAPALPFRTQAGIRDGVRTSNCYRGTGNCQKQCYETECSRSSPDGFHDNNSRVRCAERPPSPQVTYAFGLPSLQAVSGFTNGKFGGTMS